MLKKPRFRPEIRRVRLNVEQAVLHCGCYGAGFAVSSSWSSGGWYGCTTDQAKGHAYKDHNVNYGSSS